MSLAKCSHCGGPIVPQTAWTCESEGYLALECLHCGREAAPVPALPLVSMQQMGGYSRGRYRGRRA